MAERMVVLLSGINVGKAKRIAMADLRALVVSLGYSEVATHLQSGTVVLTAPAGTAATAVGERIQSALADQAGLATTVVVRTAAELTAAITADPLVEVATDPSRHLLGFPAGPVAAGAAGAVANLETVPNLVRLVADHLYLWCPDGVLASPFATVAWPKILGTTVTMRNWNTVAKVAALAAG
jgi:uncharacterized protein (DUF1697 family)